MKKLPLYLLLVLLICGSGCIPLTHMSAAPVLKPGHFECTVGTNTLAGEGRGTAFNAGIRAGIAPRVDLGLTEDALSTNLDLKVHIITDEMAGFDMAASVGAGVSILAAYRYWNVIISSKLGKWTPYFAFRNTYINKDKTDPGDEGDGVENIIYNIITSATANLNQFFIGTEYEVSKHTFFVLEGMFLPAEDTSNLTAVNAGFNFRF